MATRPHTVEAGECLSRIARRHGFSDYLAIWNHDSNRALREARGNPNVLFPGDVVQIPDKRRKTVPAGTGQRHRFVVPTARKELRIALLDGTGTPLRNAGYVLVVEDARTPGATDGNGRLTATLPMRLVSVELEIAGRRLELQLGELNPIRDLVRNDASGMQQRLRNLGYDCGPIDGVCGPRTRAAIRIFQSEHDLQIDGTPARITLDKLVGVHGS
jgi:hypothetical protein